MLRSIAKQALIDFATYSQPFEGLSSIILSCPKIGIFIMVLGGEVVCKFI